MPPSPISPTPPVLPWLARALENARLQATAQALLQCRPVAAEVGFPRLLEPEALAATAPHTVALGLRDPLDLQGLGAWVLIPAGQAVQWAERLFGGPGQAPGPSSELAPSDAELGALAYCAARLCAACDARFVLDAATAKREAWQAEIARLHQPVAFGLSLRTSHAPLSLTLVLPAALLHGECTRVSLFIPEAIPSEVLRCLVRGDLLACTDAELSITSAGVVGQLRARAAGFARELSVALDGERARGTGTTTLHAGPCIELSAREISLQALAALTSTAGLPWRVDGSETPRLVRGETELARGPLMNVRGALGMRLDVLDSSAALEER